MAVATDVEAAFRAALEAVHGGRVVASALREEPLPGRTVSVLALGKAAAVSEAALADCLRRADSAACLERMGATLETGPTGTNVMDLVLARGPSQSSSLKRV